MPSQSQSEGSGGLHGLAFALLLVVSASIPAFQIWPVPWVVSLAAYFALVALVPPLKSSAPQMRFGRISGPALGATALIAVLSWAVLTGFHHFARPDMAAYGPMLPVRAMGGIVSAGIIFSTLNAVLEELAFRFVLFEAVASERGTRAALIATSLLFGVGHLRGYPPGIVGAMLAGVYGFALGWLRVFTGGIGLPIAAHIVADVTIFAIVANSGVWQAGR